MNAYRCTGCVNRGVLLFSQLSAAQPLLPHLRQPQPQGADQAAGHRQARAQRSGSPHEKILRLWRAGSSSCSSNTAAAPFPCTSRHRQLPCGSPSTKPSAASAACCPVRRMWGVPMCWGIRLWWGEMAAPGGDWPVQAVAWGAVAGAGVAASGAGTAAASGAGAGGGARSTHDNA